MQTRSIHDFVPRRCPVWPKYHHEIITPLQNMGDYLKTMGVHLQFETRSEDFSALFERFKVVVLFAHWTDDCVEFFDGLVPIHDVARLVPTDFGGVLDLCVCHPAPLVLAIKRDHPTCLLKFTNSPATPVYWFQFYRVLFTILHERYASYSEAVEEAVYALLSSISGRDNDYA